MKRKRIIILLGRIAFFFDFWMWRRKTGKSVKK